MKILIRNPELVVTMDDEGSRQKGGAILVADGRVAAIYKEAPPLQADLEIDAKGMLLTPGLVNCHHHFYQTLTRNLPGAQDKPLFPWLRYHYEIWRELTEESLVIATRTAMAELLLSGCTLTSDHHYLFPRGASPELIDRQIEVALELGIRFQPTRGSMSLGKSDGGLPPDELCQDEETILADCRRLIGRYHDATQGAMIRIDLAPCSPFSVSERAMRETAGLAREAGVRLHTHLAETLDEERFCLERVGKRPVAYMESLDWLGRDVWLAHAVHLNDSEIELLAHTGTGVCHCPASNMRLGSGIARIRELLDAGVPVGLGVDGSASNDASHLLAEARQMLLLSRLREQGNWLGAAAVFDVATRGGARMLGRTECGTIAEGKAADLVLWDLGGLDLAGSQSDPLASLLFTATAPRAHTVIVGGKVRVKGGAIPGFDERGQARKHNAAAAAMLKAAAGRLGNDYIESGEA